MDCSIKLGNSPDCSGRSTGRRSIEENEPLTIQYNIEAPTEIEQIGGIVISKIYELNNQKSSAFKFGIGCLLFLLIIQNM